MINDGLLFNGNDLRAVTTHRQRELAQKIASEDADYVLGVSETDLTDHYVSEYWLEVPELDTDAIYVHGQRDVDIDVSGDRDRYFSGYGPRSRGG